MGKVCLLDIDVQGVENVKKSKLDCKYIFISPPSMENLEQRLRGRNTETEEKIQTRLHNAIKEMEYGQIDGKFDANIVNNSVEVAFDDLVQKLNGWYPELNLLPLDHTKNLQAL